MAPALAAAVLAPPALFGRTRARDTSARLLAAGALAEAPPRAILMVESDHWVWPLLYLQEAEQVRPDVVVLPLGLTSSSWFWRHLQRRHPELAAFDLAGPGGRLGRVRRFVDAQGDRPRAFEHLSMARTLGAGHRSRSASCCTIARPVGDRSRRRHRRHRPRRPRSSAVVLPTGWGSWP